MRLLFILIFIAALCASVGFAQCDHCPDKDECGHKGEMKAVKDLEKTLQILYETTDEYAYFKTDRAEMGYSSSYLFKYEDDLCKILTTTLTYSPKTTVGETHYIDSESDVNYTESSAKKEIMVPDEMIEFEYIFDLREIDPSKTELVSWEDESGEYNQQIDPAMGLTDPSQKYQLTYGYYRVKFFTVDGKNRILARSDAQDTETNAVSLYFSEKYYAEDFVNRFNQAAGLKKETTR